jgi:uncharacterized membrane protein YgdD (TMEM256/DUF423 family)
MRKNNFIISSFFGATAVAFGALGAHFLKSKLQAGIITADQLSGFDTATKYQLFHAIILLVITFIQTDKQQKWLNYAKYSFVAGILLFSFSIYLLSTRNLTGLHNISFLGPITPLGGLLLMLGWIFLGIHGIKSENKN